MRVDEILEEMEELVRDAWQLPLTGGKGFVNVDRVSELVNEIREALPNELRQAKAIISDRSQIISDAKDESEAIISTAEDKAKAMVEKSEIVKQAQNRADDILMEAKIQSKDMKKAAGDYVDDLMKRTDETLTGLITEVRKTRQELRTPPQE